MVIRILLFVLALVLAPISTVLAQSSPDLKKLDEISDEALQMVKVKRYEESERLLEYFSTQFLSMTVEAKFFSMDELRIITVAHNEALVTVQDESLSYDKKVNAVTKLRLVTDAVYSNHQPLWTEMEGQIMSTFNQTKIAMKNKDSDGFYSYINRLLNQYDLIYPSLKVDVAPEKIQKLDARMSFIEQYRPQVFSDSTSQKELEALEKDLESIFDEMTEDETDPSLWWVIISTGSIIILTLSYVGWRKYKGDKEEKKSDKELNN
ncbi:sporulation protein YpjB [Peribacillus alkalitolerans]|uniref:sporulation protein YpjB n=1 Tax=Peribacillus alkalitolerans TaxID=1550385 RepID=UPI0013D09A7E|nr:sporulation protein YpjB [Peribacillus alkalitolerans]